MHDDVRKIEECLAGGVTLEEVLGMAQDAGLKARIEDDLLVLEGIILVQPHGGEPETSDASSLEEALDFEWAKEAGYHVDLPFVCSVRAYHPAFDRAGREQEYGARHRTELLQEPEPECPGGAHEWLRPLEVVGGDASNPGVWANTNGGTTTIEVCPHCGLARYTSTLWWDPATSTAWEGVVRYDSQSHRDKALEYGVTQQP